MISPIFPINPKCNNVEAQGEILHEYTVWRGDINGAHLNKTGHTGKFQHFLIYFVSPPFFT